MILALQSAPVQTNTLEKAESLALKGDQSAALALYEEVAKNAYSADLFYNIGTLALSEGDFAKAALYLNKAERLSPAEDITHNLDILKNARKNRLDDQGQSSLGFIRALGHAFSANTATYIFIVAFGFSLCLLALSMAFRKKRGVALLVSLLLSGISAFALLARISVDTEVGAVVSQQTPARSAPDDEAKELFTAYPGLYGWVQDEDAGFTKLRLDNGVEIWVSSDRTEKY